MNIQIPNLDDCTTADREFLRLKFKALAKHFDALALYCDGKNHAHEFRKTGDIKNALAIERKLNEVYALLPDDFKW